MTEHVQVDDTKWTELPIVCPHCGNHGEDDGTWSENSWAPFRLIEEIVRSWIFSAEIGVDGALVLTADPGSDEVDFESGAEYRFECLQCFGEFPVPESARVEFE